MMLPAPMVAKLRRLLPMLASTHDGEVIAARNAIVRELAAGQRDLHDLADAIGPEPEAASAVDDQPPPRDFTLVARVVRDLDRGRLATHERKFVADMCKGRWPPSPKQVQWLEDLHQRLTGRRAAA